MSCRAKATFVVLDRTMKADVKRGLFYFFRIVSFAKSTKYNTREVDCDVIILCRSSCTVFPSS